MFILENNVLGIDFSSHFSHARASIEFMRTLRLPDNGDEHYLPAGLRSLDLRHIEDSPKTPQHIRSRGGIMMPMYQSEAMWINFEGDYPIALKIGSGKINAINGKPWSVDLIRTDQDYIVIPNQPWLDGFAIDENVVRQFVAVKLGAGITVEEQITKQAEFGGLQIVAYPMKREHYEKFHQEKMNESRIHAMSYGVFNDDIYFDDDLELGLAAGGKIKQQIHKDPYGMDAWDQSKAVRCFFFFLNSEYWRIITGESIPRPPITPKEYKKQNIPWFDYYGDEAVMKVDSKLDSVKSINNFDLFKQDAELNKPINVGQPVIIDKRKVTDGYF